MNHLSKHLLIVALGLLFSLAGNGQEARVTVKGQEGVLKINRLYLDADLGESQKMKGIPEDGATVYSVDAGEYLLLLPSDTFRLWLEAGDQLVVARTGNEWNLDGKGAANNALHRQFFKQFANDFSDSLQQADMMKLGIDAYEMQLFAQRRKQKEYLAAQSNRGETASSLEYLRTTVEYHYWQLLLAHPITQANSSPSILKVNALPAPMLEGFDKVKRSNPSALSSPAYRAFLKYFVTYFTSEANQFNKFKDYSTSAERKLAFASGALEGEPYCWWMARHLLDECERLSPYIVKKFKSQIETNDPSHKYRSVLPLLCDMKKLQATVSQDNGAGKAIAAPAASGGVVLTDLKGKRVDMEDFKGKVVYIDFWASWCGPCRNQMPFSKQLHAKLTDKQKKQIVFLYISIDAKEDAWRKAILDMGIEGVNVISPGNWQSDVCQYYQINSIPRYMIMNKKGEIVESNAPRPGDESLLDMLLRYTEE